MSRERALNDPFRTYYVGRFVRSHDGRRVLMFGKWKHHRIESIPFSYLEWLLERCRAGEFDEELAQVVEREIEGRKRFNHNGTKDTKEGKASGDQYVRP